MNKVRLPAVCNCQGYLRVRQAGCARSFPIHHCLSSSCPSSSLISWPLTIFVGFTSFAFFLLLLHPRSLHFPTSPSHLSSSCFSYHFASHPRGDGEQWIYSNAGWWRENRALKRNTGMACITTNSSLLASTAHSAHLSLCDTNVAGKMWLIPQDLHKQFKHQS